MKKTVTVRELKEYYEKHQANKITFCTKNQEWYYVCDPCSFTLTFPVMVIFENPNAIYLKSEHGTMYIGMVRRARIDTESSVLGTVLTIFCEDCDDKEDDISYTLITT